MIGDVTGNTNSNYSADNIDLNVDLQGSSNQLTFRFGNKSETYNTPNNLGDGAFLTTVGFQTYSAYVYNGNITQYGTYGGTCGGSACTNNYGSMHTGIVGHNRR